MGIMFVLQADNDGIARRADRSDLLGRCELRGRVHLTADLLRVQRVQHALDVQRRLRIQSEHRELEHGEGRNRS